MRRLIVSVAAAAALLSGCSDDASTSDGAFPGSDEECVGYGCSPEQDAEINAGEAEANADEPSAAPMPEAFAVGETAEFDGGITTGTITLNGVRRIAEPEAEYSSAVPTNGSWLVIDVTVQVASRTDPGGALISSYDFTVQDPTGLVYPSDSMALETSLSTEVLPGRQVRGEVAFDAPAGVLLLDWAPGLGTPLVTFEITG